MRNSTTKRSRRAWPALVVLVALTWPLVAHTDEVSEIALVKGLLAGKAHRSATAASQADEVASGTVTPYLSQADLMMRREESIGPAPGFNTTAVGLSVSLEIGGRHGLQRRKAALLSAAVVNDRHARLFDQVCRLRWDLLSMHLEQSRVALLAANRTRFETLVRNLAKLVSSGEKAPFDLERARLTLQDRVQTLRRRRAHLEARTAGVAAISGVALTRVKLLDAPADPSAKGAGSGDRAHPALRALERRVKAAALQQEVARRTWVPDLGLYAAYRLDRSNGLTGHGYELGLTFDLPMPGRGRKIQAEAAATRSQLKATGELLASRRRSRIAALRARLAVLADSRGKEDRVDLDKLWRDATRRYLSGVTPLSTLMDSLEAIEAAALGRIESEADYRRALLGLECQTGSFASKVLAKLIKEAIR